MKSTKENSSQSQESKILAWLKRGRTITPLDALSRFDCFRLSARIMNLRKYNIISTTIIETPTGKHVARYQFVKEK